MDYKLRIRRVLVIVGIGAFLISSELLVFRSLNHWLEGFADGLGTLFQRATVVVDLVSAASKLTPHPKQGCRYMKARSDLSGYESGGPYILDHFRLTKGRTDLREFLWTHWHDHKKGVAEARAGTVDRGTVKVLYLIQPDAKGQWGLDAELDRPMDPPCVAFHADSLVRVPIAKPDEDYPSQTLGLWPANKLPQGLLSDSEVKDAKLFRVILVRENKPVGDEI